MENNQEDRTDWEKYNLYKPGSAQYYQDQLKNIWAVCVDYDGFRTVKGLKMLIDDIKKMASNAIANKSLYIK